ncbi:MAG: hypothetical protein ACK5OX_13020 [Desertimonas sp.]
MVGDALWFAVPVLVCAGMLWVAFRMEPHWSSKDGRRFLTMAQPVDRHRQPLERRYEVRGSVTEDGLLRLTRRGVLRRGGGQRFRVLGALESPPAGKAVYVLDAQPPGTDGAHVLLRLPATSPVVAMLDDLSRRETPPAAEPADRD